jgi:hypothetical protein
VLDKFCSGSYVGNASHDDLFIMRDLHSSKTWELFRDLGA